MTKREIKLNRTIDSLEVQMKILTLNIECLADEIELKKDVLERYKDRYKSLEIKISELHRDLLVERDR